MINRTLIMALLSFAVFGCHHHAHHDENEEIKIKYTAYNSSYELFAEADAFVVGEKANILSHFTNLPSFEALKSGEVSVILKVNKTEVKQTLKSPTRLGIYSFDITPKESGIGSLTFIIDTSIIMIQNVIVYKSLKDAQSNAISEVPSMTNTAVFTKEQSWKIDFKTEFPTIEPFGEIIKTVAKIEPATGNEIVISAKTSGIIQFSDFNLYEGKNVSIGQNLLSISSGEMSENNISVKLIESRSNFEQAEADYSRKKVLASERIISENDLLNAKNHYEKTKATYENLINNFSTTGQTIKSSMSGFVKQIFVSNGQYVEIGKPLVTISQNQKLILNAFVQQRYFNKLPSIYSANIKTLYDNMTYSFEELNGVILSYGQSVSDDNYLIPIHLQIDNKGGFIQGSFIDVYLKTMTNAQALTVPNSAILEEQGNYFVYVQINPELFEKREVKIGSTDGIKTEVLSGLIPTERIISKGAIIVKVSQTSGALDAHSGHVH